MWNLFKLASYGKFVFSRPNLDGNKLCLARKREIEKCLSSRPRVVIFDFLNF